MKNVLVYISPSKSFNTTIPGLINDAEVCAKVQIENSLMWGWERSDIHLLTNFDFEHKDVRATVLKDVEFFDRKPQASKINAIIQLFENGFIQEGETYWFHDLDAFQICNTAALEIDLGKFDMAMADYGYSAKWNTGVIYFKKSAKDLFIKMRDLCHILNTDEERAFKVLTDANRNEENRIKKINTTYNFTPRYLPYLYSLSNKPIKIIHFHPLGGVDRHNREMSFDVFKGQNELGIQIIPDYMLTMFSNYGIK